MRRSGGFVWPPPKENYVYTGLEGALGQARILSRNGYPDVWEWQDRAILRAYQWLHQEAKYPAVGNDTHQIWLVNFAYGSTFPTVTPSQPGRAYGYDDWLHSAVGSSVPPPLPGPYDFTFHLKPLSETLWEATGATFAGTAGTGADPDEAVKSWLAGNDLKPPA
jgi:hypothetical protein